MNNIPVIGDPCYAHGIARGHRITHFRCDFFEKRRLSNVGVSLCDSPVNTDTFYGPFGVRINPSNIKIKI